MPHKPCTPETGADATTIDMQILHLMAQRRRQALKSPTVLAMGKARPDCNECCRGQVRHRSSPNEQTLLWPQITFEGILRCRHTGNAVTCCTFRTTSTSLKKHMQQQTSKHAPRWEAFLNKPTNHRQCMFIAEDHSTANDLSKSADQSQCFNCIFIFTVFTVACSRSSQS